MFRKLITILLFCVCAYRLGSPIGAGGACCASAVSSSVMITARKFLTTSSKGLAPKALEYRNSNYCILRFKRKNIKRDQV